MQEEKKGGFVMDEEFDDMKLDNLVEAPQNKLKPLTIHQDENDGLNATYSFVDEDHTLGNLLRNQLLKSGNVEFCAYSVPHPSEPVMNVRL
jgi:DNA-directed RNA polymerase I and III subunit RPAC2